MTREEAINHLMNDFFVSLGGQLCVDADKKGQFCEAIGKGVSALRAQQEAEKNEPLTLDELREMGGEPYWHVGLRKKSAPPHWNILDPFVALHIEDYKYGENWLAYRRKPEEARK